MGNLQRVIFLSTLLSLFNEAQAQSIEWVSFEKLSQKFRQATKPLLIFLGASWCKYCELQKATTFQDTTLVNALNKNFYCLELDVESGKEISFFGRTYKPQPNQYHEIALFLAGSQVVLPTTVILSDRLVLQHQWKGIAHASDLIKYIHILEK